VKSTILEKVKKTEVRIILFFIGLSTIPKLLKLKRNVFYTVNKKIKFEDQLANPNKEKVTGYYQKINDKSAARRFGTQNLEEYSFWAWRSCAPAVISMILKTENKYKGNIYKLVRWMLKRDGYLFETRDGRKDIGWKHSALKAALQHYGLTAQIMPFFHINEVIYALSKGWYVIASIKSRLNPKSGHIILISGIFWSGKNSKLIVYDPCNLDGRGGRKEESLEEFKKEFLNKGIIVKKNVKR
jgi:hypothetical protein